jgi:nucleotide-binding universal stress UspA family protein
LKLLSFIKTYVKRSISMYNKIMVAIDNSEMSQSVLQEALHIAGSYGAKLYIVHAASNSDDASLLENARIAAGTALDVEIRLLEVDAEYGLNGIAEAIANAAAEWEADLVVVGTANRRGLERLVLGSVAEQLVSKIGASILLVRLH